MSSELHMNSLRILTSPVKWMVYINISGRVARIPITYDDVFSARVGMHFDNLTTYHDFTQILVKPDPVIHRREDTMTIKTYGIHKDTTIDIAVS